MIYHVIIVGLGPAGLMASNILEKYKISYLALEKNEMSGKKLLLTGGKRCNVTNHYSVSDFINHLTIKHKKFLYPCLISFGPKDTIDFFKNNQLTLELEDFKYFPSTHQSKSVLDALMKNLNPNNLRFKENVIEIKKKDGLFLIKTKTTEWMSRYVILSVGSNSFPSTGSSGDGNKFAKQLDIEFKEFTPAETHVYSNQVVKEYSNLQGVSIDTSSLKIQGSKKQYQGGIIFTHFGLSGPAIYHASEDIYHHLLEKDTEVVFSLTQYTKEEVMDLLNDSKTKNIDILTFLEKVTTKRIAKMLLVQSKINSIKIKEISNKSLEKLMSLLLEFKIKIDKVEDKEKAYVNQGGILTSELNPNTMESKKIKGLYFAGEMIDIHGPIGGFNITMALSTGHLAANSIIKVINENT